MNKSVDLPLTSGDPVQLQQILLNLFMNAMDAMDGVAPARRTISVSTAMTDEGGVEVRHIGLWYGTATVTGAKCLSAVFYDEKTGAWPRPLDLRVHREAAWRHSLASKQRE